MADEKKNLDQNEDVKLGEDLSLDDLLLRLRDEHGVDFGQKESADKKSKKSGSDSENELDDYEFDNRPIEADYLNYNIIGRGGVKKEDSFSDTGKTDDAVTGLADEMKSVSNEPVKDVEMAAEEEDLPWDDVVEETPKQEETIYGNMRERYLRQRGLWQDTEDDSDVLTEEDLSENENLFSESGENSCTQNREEILSDETESASGSDGDIFDSFVEASVLADGLGESAEDFEMNKNEEDDETNKEEEVLASSEAPETVDEFEESEAYEEPEKVEEHEEFGYGEELEDFEELDELEDLDELEELDELDESAELEEIGDSLQLENPEDFGESGDAEDTNNRGELESHPELEDWDDLLDDTLEDEQVLSEDFVSDELEDLSAEEIEDDRLSEFADILTDINLMLDGDGVSEYDLSDALGMTSRTSYVKPKERHRAASTPIEDEQPKKPVRENVVLPSRKGHKEYTGYAQNAYIKKGYRSKLRMEGIQCIALVILAAVAFVLESLHLFGVMALHPSVNPTLAVAVSAMVMLVASALVIWEYVDGAILLFRGTPVPESLMLPATVVPLLYYIVALVSGGVSLSLFGFAFCICALICKLQTLFRAVREARTFAIVSREKPKRALSTLNRENAMPESDVFSAYLSPEAEYHCVKRTLFVDDYFKTTNKVANNKKTISVFLIVSSLIALLVFAFAYVRLEQFTSAFSYAVISFFYTLPFSCLFLFEIPLLWASFSAAEDNAAIVGEAAIENFTKEGAVSFADTDLFPPTDVSLANILLFRETEMEKMMKYTALVFDEIHSSVSTVIMRSIPGYKLNDEIRIANVYDDGIEAYVNSEQVLVGSCDFIKRFGASLPARYVHKKNGYAQMFTAVSGEVLGKFDIDYVLDPEIPEALSHIAESGFYVAVRTLDPNITPEFLAEKLDYKNYPVKLIKVNDDRELLRMRKKVSAPIVTTDKTKSLMKALVLCDKSAFAQMMGLIFAAAGVLTGVGIVIVSILMGNTAFISGTAIVLFQLFWLLPIFFVSMLYVKNRSNKEKKKNRFFHLKK